METPPPSHSKAHCGLLGFLSLQKLFLDVPALSSLGWGWHTRLTWKLGPRPQKQAATSWGPQCPGPGVGQVGPSRQDLGVAVVCSSLKSLPILSWRQCWSNYPRGPLSLPGPACP